MAVNLLWPAYVRLAYHSTYGAHEQIVATREWSPTPLVPLNVLGSYTNWAGVPCDGEEMIQDLVDAMSAFNPATTVYDTAVIYTLATPESPAIPRASKNLATVGTQATPGWTKATQRAWIFRDTEWQIAKLYQLDTGTTNNWDPTTSLTGNVPAQTLVGAYTSLNWAWASRNGERPNTFMKATIKLNDKLRKEYNMA